MPSRPCSASHLERRDLLDEVDLALDQRLHGRVLALVDAEDDLVDVRGALPVVRVGLEAVRRAARRALHEPERAGADHRVLLARLVGVALHLVLGDVLPDVLGDDRDREQREDRVGLLQGQHDGGVVGGVDRLDADEVRRPGRGLRATVEDPAEGVGHVGRRSAARRRRRSRRRAA